MKKQPLQFRLTGLIALLILQINLIGQSMPGAINIIPLSPNAAELNKYTSIPVNGMTGVPSIGFPIYELNTGKIKLPISLSYHASGIKVTQKATWVGLGWSLNAGGTISRGVRGIEDEELKGWFNDTTSWTRLDQLRDLYYSGTSQQRYDSYNEMANEWVLNPGHDTHPDFFGYSVGSKSGKFLYSRAQQKFIALPYEPVKINRNSINNTYTIADDDGTVYYFEAQEIAQYTIGSANAERQRVQSWYLSRIVSADGTDTVYLNYDINGLASNLPEKVVSYTRTYKRTNTHTYTASEAIRNESETYNSVLELKEIVFRQGKISFFANTARQDYTGKALDSIVVYSKKDGVYNRVNKYSFSYDYFYVNGAQVSSDYRLKLLSFKKEDISGGQPVVHQFEYNSTPLPNTNSFAADYWGFYNGHGGTTLLPAIYPIPEIVTNQMVGDAGREPDTNYVRAGILQKIIYPTGGYTVFDFEPNTYKLVEQSTDTYVLISSRLYGIGTTQLPRPVVTKQENFQIPQAAISSTCAFDITFSPYVPGDEGIPQQVILKDLTTGTDIKTWEHTGNGFATQTYNETYTFDKTHQYQFYLMVQNHTSTYINVELRYNKLNESTFYRPGAGVRIKTITTYDIDNTVKDQQVYKYGGNESGIGKLLISDRSMRHNYYQLSYKEPTSSSSGVCCPYNVGDITVYVGNITYPSFSFLGVYILYDTVTIYQIGNGTPNGKTVQAYAIPNDFQLIISPRLPGGFELMDKSLFGQQLLKETKYAYNQTNNDYRAIEERELKYIGHNGSQEPCMRFSEQVSYFMNGGCSQDKIMCFGATISDFNYAPYNIQLGCYRPDSIIQKTYDEYGNALQTVQKYEYHNGLHLYPSAISTINSKGEVLKTFSKYPGDHTTSDPNSSVLDRMVSLNFLHKPYWSGNYNGSALLKYTETIYNNQWNSNANLVLPQKTQTFNNITAPVLAKYSEVKSYDSYGNPLIVTDNSGLYKLYIWDYLSTYPIAEVVNASTENLAYTSFEADGTGNWTISSVSRDATQSITGQKSYQLSNGSISKSSLTTSANYIISYWTKNASAFTINGTQSIEQGKTINGWTCFVHTVTGVSQVTISGTGMIDELRLFPAFAQMTTYTYDPLIGMTSQCDTRNGILYYEYDGMGRLKLIRDQDKNILKTFDYKYQAQQ